MEASWNAAVRHLKGCRLCGNECNADRSVSGSNVCEASEQAEVAWMGVHHGEEPPISGTRGCGNIFFLHCSMACVYCQNWQISSRISHEIEPVQYTEGRLADEMLRLQEAGVHTLGLVGATPHLLTVVPALVQARLRGLQIPVVYNSGGYDSVESIQMLDGLVDVYLPDMKYGSDAVARVYSGVPRYVSTNRLCVQEMARQVGPLILDGQGIARRGLLIRHLILPGGLADTEDVLGWIARNLGADVHLSLMSQYKPSFQIVEGLYPELNRTLTEDEYSYYLYVAQGLGFRNLYTQELSSCNVYNPDFTSQEPFVT